MDETSETGRPAVRLVGSLPWYTLYETNGAFYAVPATLRVNLKDFGRLSATAGVRKGDSARDLKIQLSATWGHPIIVDNYKGYDISRWSNLFFAARKAINVFEDKFESDNAVIKAYTIDSLRSRIEETLRGGTLAGRSYDIPSANTKLMRDGGAFIKLTTLAGDELSRREFGRIKGVHLQQIQAQLSARTTTTEPSDVVFHMREFQKEAFESRRISTLCPVCGRGVFSVFGIPVCPDSQSATLFFEFQCCVRFFIIFGFNPCQLVGLFTESETYVFSFLNYVHPTMSVDWDHQKIVHLISCYYFLRHKGLTATAPARTAYYVAFGNNLGHHIRDELPALVKFIRLFANGKRQDVTLVFGPNDFFDLETSVSESVRDKIVWGKDESPLMRLARHCREGEYFPCLAASSEHYYPEIGKLVTERANKLGLRETPRLRFIKPYPRRIWFTVRNSSRRWVSQLTGSIAIASEVLKKWPDACIIFDGVESSRKIVAEIIEKVSDPSRCVDAVGISLVESMLLFSYSDFFIMPYSNSTSFIFIFEKSGVFHGYERFVPKGPFTLLSGQGQNCVGVQGHHVATGNRFYDEYINTADYDLDHKILLEEIFRLMDRLQPTQPVEQSTELVDKVTATSL